MKIDGVWLWMWLSSQFSVVLSGLFEFKVYQLFFHKKKDKEGS